MFSWQLKAAHGIQHMQSTVDVESHVGEKSKFRIDLKLLVQADVWMCLPIQVFKRKRRKTIGNLFEKLPTAENYFAKTMLGTKN